GRPGGRKTSRKSCKSAWMRLVRGPGARSAARELKLVVARGKRADELRDTAEHVRGEIGEGDADAGPGLCVLPLAAHPPDLAARLDATSLGVLEPDRDRGADRQRVIGRDEDAALREVLGDAGDEMAIAEEL